jgi:sigma-E factor negative regulatory protein RseA
MNNPDQAASMTTQAPPAGETLSCLIDGELDPAESTKLLGSVGADRAARREWLLLHVVGDALRSAEVAGLQSDRFLLRMGAALEAEPPILAPVRPRRDRVRLVWRVVLPGAAIAAAAAMLVVIAVPQLRGDAPPPPAQIAGGPARSAPVAAPLAPVASAPAGGAANEVRRLGELEAYLAAHREVAGGTMMPRTAPYLRASVPAQR